MDTEWKVTVRFHSKSPHHDKAIKILQQRTKQCRKSYADIIAEAIVGYYGVMQLFDDDLAAKIADKVAERLHGFQTINAPERDSAQVTAPEIEDSDIDWSFLGG